jgi:hypothetical protein
LSDVSHEQILRVARFSSEDVAEINQRRRANNRLGFAYQMAFVRLHNRFPAQQPLEVIDELLIFVSVQIGIATDAIEACQQRRETIADHQQQLREFLGLRRFGEVETTGLEDFLFTEACRLEQTGPLLVKAKVYLRNEGVLQPADDTIRGLIARQREQARQHIFAQIAVDASVDENG